MKPLKVMKAALEKRCVTRALRKHDGCVAHVARELAVDRKVVYRLIAKYELNHLVRAHQGAPPLKGNAAWHALADA